MTARRKRKSKKKTNQRSKYLKIFIFLVLIFILVFFLKPNKFVGEDKFSIGIRGLDENIYLVLIDSKNEKITKIVVPNNTQVEVAGGYGRWKVGSVWELGYNEKLEGQLLADTLFKNFGIPVHSWGDYRLLEIFEKNFIDIVKGIFVPLKTNLSFGDRAKLAIFSMGVSNHNRDNILLKNTSFLKVKKLESGEDGYEVTNNVPIFIYILGSEDLLVKNGAAVLVVNRTGTSAIVDEVGKLFGILGGKVSLVKTREPEDIDCRVRGKNQKMVLRITDIFGCDRGEGEFGGNFDIEMILGTAFAKRF